MKKFLSVFLSGAAMVAMLGTLTGCQSGGQGGSANYYYGSGYYDPWYHGDYYVEVIPPPIPDNPPNNGLRPTHPIAEPPQVRPSPPPRPSIPSAPRPMPRIGGGRR